MSTFSRNLSHYWRCREQKKNFHTVLVLIFLAITFLFFFPKNCKQIDKYCHINSYAWPSDIHNRIHCCVDILWLSLVFDACFHWSVASLHYHTSIYCCFKVELPASQLMSQVHRIYYLEVNTRKCYEKSVLKKFAKFTGKYLRRIPFFSNVPGPGFATLFKKKLNHRCFLGNWKFLSR